MKSAIHWLQLGIDGRIMKYKEKYYSFGFKQKQTKQSRLRNPPGFERF